VQETLPEEEPVLADAQEILVKISHYDPSLGGTNCAWFADGVCLSNMANGENWTLYYGNNDTIACPQELEFGTQILLDGNVYTCRDRGGAIVVTESGEYWIDILAPSVPYWYGEIKQAYILN